MKPTSSPSARATPSAAPELDISGIPPTGLTSVDIWRTQYWGQATMTDLEFAWWQLKRRILHWFGQHSWIPIEHWDKPENGGMVEIIGYSCWFCPRTKRL